jgi:hypothetical protein
MQMFFFRESKQAGFERAWSGLLAACLLARRRSLSKSSCTYHQDDERLKKTRLRMLVGCNGTRPGGCSHEVLHDG